MPGCAQPTADDSYYFGPIEKDFAIPTLKQTWAVSEVNDPSFGVGASFCNGSLVGNQELDVYCMGLAVYYIPGVAAPLRRQPNVCINT